MSHCLVHFAKGQGDIHGIEMGKVQASHRGVPFMAFSMKSTYIFFSFSQQNRSAAARQLAR
jgi:hypothetical protein